MQNFLSKVDEMILKTLYKQDTNGRLRSWSVEVDDSAPQYRTLSGIVDMKMNTTKWKVAKEKNSGKNLLPIKNNCLGLNAISHGDCTPANRSIIIQILYK